MAWFSKRRNAGTHRRASLALESLEGRRLLTNGIIATTLDRNGNPLFARADASGAVVVNLEQPTNDITNPYQYTGYQALPGLTASSLTATTLSNGDPVLYAKPKALSYLFANEYVATGDPANPYTWSGWQQVGGNFVTTSATAATSGTTSAVFAIGADSQVYVASVVPATTPATASTLSAFEPLPAFGATSISVLGLGDTSFEVAALAGVHTYVSGIRVVPTADGTTPTTSGWQQLGDFVAVSINLTPGLNTTAFGASLGDRVFLFAVGTDGNIYYDPLTPNTTTFGRDSTTYTVIGGGDVVASRATISAGYMTVYELTATGGIGEFQLVASGLTSSPISLYSSYAISLNGAYYSNDFSANAMAVAPLADGGFDLVASSTDGTVQVDQQNAHDALNAEGYYGFNVVQNSYSGFTDVAARSAHPVAASAGPGGGNVVAAIGSDGTIYASVAAAATTASPTLAFSAFSALAGVTATSIAAAQLDAAGEMAVYALTGASSLVYENQYLATGDSTTPFAWTGWRPLGTFVATSIAAAYTPGASQATVFAIGTDGVVAATDRTASLTAPTTTTFTPLSGLTAATIAVRGYDDSTVEIVATTGVTSLGYTQFYTPSGVTTPSTTSPPTGQWFATGNYFLRQVAGGRNGKYLVGVSPYGYEAATSSYQATDPTVSDNYVALGFSTTPSDNVQYSSYRSAGLVAIDNATGDDATIQLVIPPPAVYQEYYNPVGTVYIATGGGTTTSAAVTTPTIPTGAILKTLGASTAAVESEYYIGDSLGRIYISQFGTDSTATAPTFTAYALVGTLPT